MNVNEIIKFALIIPDTYIAFRLINFLKITWAAKKHKDRIILYPYENEKNAFDLRKYEQLVFFIPATILLIYLNFFTFIVISAVIFICSISFFISPDVVNVLQSNNLNLGYGAALCYYKNYLNFNVPYNFVERVQEFRAQQQVDVECKLYILVPRSCKVRKYIDAEPDSEHIERCRELKPVNQTHAGFQDRVYTITVYLLRKQGIRLAVEYAQPLKALYAMKEKTLISEEEMFKQRDLFFHTLQKFLKDEHDSYKFCELIDYDDEKKKAFEVLLERCSHN